MSNMSYCRFQNTLRDLLDCQSALSEGCDEDDDFSEDEYEAMHNLINTCKEIADNYYEEPEA
jgi:hypothetical protein